MKILKYVFLLLLLSVVAVTVFIATQEGKYDIKKERIIKAPNMVLYNYINDYKNWEIVGILTDSIENSVFNYSENSSGQGAEMSWKNGNSTNTVQTTHLSENDSIVQKAVINDLNSEIFWTFKDTLKSTKVTIRIKGELSFKEKANALFKGESINSDLEVTLKKGLDNLNEYLVHELTLYDIKVKEDGLVSKTGAFYIGQAATSKIEDINKKTAEIFPKLLAFMKKNRIVKKGSPFVMYRTIDKANNTASYVVCMPIQEEIFTSPGSEYEGGKLQAFNALKTTLKGDYSHLRKAWDKGQQYIIAQGLQENTSGQYIELYTKGVQKTKRPSEWVTDIYIPIGRPTVAPIIDDTTPVQAQPVKPTTAATPVTTGTRPVTTGTKPAAGATPSANKPAGTTAMGTTKPATGTAKPATTTGTKPAGTATVKQATGSGTTMPKPAPSKPATTTPVNKPAQPDPTTTP
jgi:predicted transcriptional regulator YdeE